MIRSYQDLRVWKIAMDFAADVYCATASTQKGELRGLIDQLRRSAVSIPANIAEGYGRESAKSYVQFLKVARGSLYEAETHIILAKRLGRVEQEASTELLASAENISKMLNGLIRSIAAGRREAQAG